MRPFLAVFLALIHVQPDSFGRALVPPSTAIDLVQNGPYLDRKIEKQAIEPAVLGDVE